MIIVYFNYARDKQPRVMIHNDRNCPDIQQHNKKQQRYYKIDIGNISAELSAIINQTSRYEFAGHSPIQDMWIEIDFNDKKFELAILDYIISILSQRYMPFINSLDTHSPCP